MPTDSLSLSQLSLNIEEIISSLLLEEEPAARQEAISRALQSKWLLAELGEQGLSFYLHLLVLLARFERVEIDWSGLSLSMVWERELSPLYSIKRLLCSLVIASLTRTPLSSLFFESLSRYFASCDHTGSPFLFYKGDEGREKSGEIAQYHALLVQSMRGALEVGSSPSPFFQAIARTLTLYERPSFEGYASYRGASPLFHLLKKGRSSIAIGPSGEGGGLGAFHLNRLRLLNFGPHEGALDDFSQFGIDLYREGAKEKGWLRTRGGEWFFFTPTIGDGELSIKVDFAGKSAAHFIFFFTADSAALEGGKTLLRKRGLQSYRGRAIPLSFHLGDEVFHIEPWQAGEMELIPLSGDQDFWGADFYLSYDLSPRRTSYGWRIDASQ